MRIAIDAMGGDRAPEEVVKGALAAARDFKVGIILVGDESAIRKYLPGKLPPGIEVQHASEVVEMGAAPTQVRRKRDSSIAVATQLHADGHAQAVLSAGNTGAAAAAALFILKRIPGVDRPGIATIFPTSQQPLVLLDAGANVDCRPRHLAQFALMGAAYSRCILKIVSSTAGDFFGIASAQSSSPVSAVPSVGLLSIGEEENKGNDLTKAAYKLLHSNTAQGKYSFYGNVEGRDIGAGTVDVVVCDGFVGNVVLKVAEGLAKMFGSELRRALTSDWRAKIGALILSPALMRFRKRLDYTEFGGAALLGVNGVCIICHGSSDSRSIYSAIRIAMEIDRADVVGSIRDAIQRTTLESTDSPGETAALESDTALSSEQFSNGANSSLLSEQPSDDTNQPIVPPINF